MHCITLNVLKHYLVSNEILIKLLFCCCFSFTQYHFILFLYSVKNVRILIFLSLCSLKCKLHAYLVNLCTENSAIAYDKYYILIYNTDVTEFSHNSTLNVFQTIDWGFTTFFEVRKHATATNDAWVDQCAVCLALKLDTFILVTVTLTDLVDFEKLNLLWKLMNLRKKKITLLTSSKYKTSFSLKIT